MHMCCSMKTGRIVKNIVRETFLKKTMGLYESLEFGGDELEFRKKRMIA